MIEYRLLASEPIGNLFYVHAVIFEIAFYNKTTCLLKRECFNRDL